MCRRERSAVRALLASLTRGRSPAQVPVTSSGVKVDGRPGVDRPQHVLDVLGGALRIVERPVVVGVGGPEVGETPRTRGDAGLEFVRGPWHHEDGTLVARHGQHRGKIARQLLGRYGQVDALRGSDRHRAGGGVAGQVSHLFGPHPAGVDHHLGPHLGAVEEAGAGDPAVPFDQLGDGRVVGQGGAVLGGRAGQGQGQPGVVGLGVPILERGGQAISPQQRKMGQRFGGVDPAVPLADADAAGDVV